MNNQPYNPNARGLLYDPRYPYNSGFARNTGYRPTSADIYGNWQNKNCDPCSNGQLYGKPYPCAKPQKDPYPLKSFADPGLNNTCATRALVNPFAPKRSVSTWRVNYLVSNEVDIATFVDNRLINPWGIVIYNNQLWVANGGTDSITNYDLYGNKLDFEISVRDVAHNSSYPTGIVVNCGVGFPVTGDALTKSATFLVATEHGTVHGFDSRVDSNNSFIVLNEQLTGEVSVYKGLAVANNTMYLANFFQRQIDVFDGSYNRLSGFHFIDADTANPIPIDYGPFNIVHIGCYLYVLWARKNPNITVANTDGPGTGYISVFNLDGSFVRRFTSGGALNAPWAMIPAPCECGFPPGSFWVGNNGDGRILAYDCIGKYIGPVLGPSGQPISIEGLWGLAPHYNDFSQVYFVSSPNPNLNGNLGNIVKDQIIQL